MPDEIPEFNETWCKQAWHVIPSSGCIFCDIGLPTIKMKRQHIHRVGRGGWCTVVCPLKGIKPMSDGSKSWS